MQNKKISLFVSLRWRMCTHSLWLIYWYSRMRAWVIHSVWEKERERIQDRGASNGMGTIKHWTAWQMCVCVSVIKFVRDDGNIWGSMGISVPQYKVTLSLRRTHTVSPPLIFSQTLQIHITHLSLPPFCQNTPGIMTNRVTLYWTSHTLVDKYTKSSKYNSVIQTGKYLQN